MRYLSWFPRIGSSSPAAPANSTRHANPVCRKRFGSIPSDTIADEGVTAAFFETLHFCPTCKTSYESTAQSEFSRVASLGTEGRASAVTVLSQAVVRALRETKDLDTEAKKFLAFSDNRQDASLQAGHFNDFVLVGLVRSAVYQAVLGQAKRHPDEPLTDDDLGRRVVESLQVSSPTTPATPTWNTPRETKPFGRCGSRWPTGCGQICAAAGASPCPTSSRPASCC